MVIFHSHASLPKADAVDKKLHDTLNTQILLGIL
jgi:hypothetical protein